MRPYNQNSNCLPSTDDVKVCHFVTNGASNIISDTDDTENWNRYVRSTECDIRIFTTDSQSCHEGVWNFGGRAPLVLNLCTR
jgi:hypothetical protein